MVDKKISKIQKISMVLLIASLIFSLGFAGSNKILQLEEPRMIVQGDKITVETNLSNTGGKALPETNYTVDFRVNTGEPKIRSFSIRGSADLDRGESFKISKTFTPQDLGVESVEEAKQSLGKEVIAECEKCTIKTASDIPLFEEVDGRLEKITGEIRIVKDARDTRKLPQSIQVVGSDASDTSRQLNIVNGDSVSNSRFSYILMPQGDSNPVIESFAIRKGYNTVIDIDPDFDIRQALVCPTMDILNSGECISSEAVEEEQDQQEDTEDEETEEEQSEEEQEDSEEDKKEQEKVKNETVTEKDSDSDGVVDKRDNCPETPNRAQKDKNNNGMGDACEEIEKETPSVVDKVLSTIGSWF